MPSKGEFSRRDLLKLMSVAPAAWFMQPLLHTSDGLKDSFNIIVLVFDAWSALDVSLFGYPRQTMPSLERFADQATIYHHHYAAGTFTVPGTASLLSGTYPWTHRALQLGAAIIKPRIPDQVFAALRGVRSTVAYGQNMYADLLIGQAYKDVDVHIPNGSFDLQHRLFYSLPFFARDQLVANASIESGIFGLDYGPDGSLVGGPLYRLLQLRTQAQDDVQWMTKYPNGVPSSWEDFTLEAVVDGAIQTLSKVEAPSFVYFHFFPPHDPYKPTKDFIKDFSDRLKFVEKPLHPLAFHKEIEKAPKIRRLYDQYIASWDAEVGRLFDYLKSSGLLDKSYVFLTADHGEMFERGETGHWTPLMFDPVLHIPLIVRVPGQTEQKHVQAFTSNVDILPTVAGLAGIRVPAWAEGQALPELGGTDDPNRSIFAVDAKSSPAFAPLRNGFSLAIARAGYRLVYYRYHGTDRFELYDLQEDPEEIRDLYPASPAIASKLKDELLQKLSEVNRPYQRGNR